MGRRHEKSLALSLRTFDYSETSQVVHLYARELGKIHCIAKGSKRRKSAFHGPFDVLCLYEITRLEKEPGALDLLTGAETLKDYRGVRESYARFAAASYVADLVDEFTPEAQPQPELFDALRRTLDRLNEGAPVAQEVFGFEAAFLRELGHFPRTDACGACRKPPSGSDLWFSVRDGGVFCASCSPRDPNRILTRRVVIDALQAFRHGRPFPMAVTAGIADDLRRLLDAHLRYVFDREPKSARFMRQALLAAEGR
ncbi:MAG: DNA repair protein RecO [Planctomycetes bacterium]|nr:DNA repair protein RecO [Planctomycetota bacterium]